MRFPAVFWIRVAGLRYHAKRLRRISGTASDTRGTGQTDEREKTLELLRNYPTLEAELVNILHENTHEIADEYGIDALDIETGDKAADKDTHREVDRLAQGRSQFIQSMIEQGILVWGPAMERGDEDTPESA